MKNNANICSTRFLTEEPSVAGAGKPTGKGRVLLIHDGIMRQSIVRTMLGACGYSVYESRNDDRAVEEYLCAKDVGYPFDFVVMDLNVSYSIGGRETITKLIKADPDVRVIISPVSRIDPVMKQYEDYGFRCAIAKPFTVEELRKTIAGSGAAQP